jgi:hypothetical protein
MGIDPKLAIWLNVAYAILTALSIPMLEAMGFKTHASVILAWTGFIAIFLNAVLHGFSSNAPGPAARQDPPVVKAAKKLDGLTANAYPVEIIDAKESLYAAIETKGSPR